MSRGDSRRMVCRSGRGRGTGVVRGEGRAKVYVRGEVSFLGPYYRLGIVILCYMYTVS